MPWYVQPHAAGEVLLGDMSTALLSHGNVLGVRGGRTALQLVPGVSAEQTPLILHSNSASAVSLLLRRARELSKVGRSLTLVSRDDVKIPNNASRRMWRAIQQASRRAGKRAPIWYVQNVALPVEPGIRPFPIGVAQANELAAFLERAGGLEARLTQRQTLLACGLMQTKKLPARARAVASMKRNGFECSGAGDADVALARRLGGSSQLSEPRQRSWHFYSTLVRAKFVLSPEGFGRDCFRTWEALALGAIPVLLRITPNTSAADAAKFDGLPIVWVRRWSTVTRPFLERAWVEMRGREYNAAKAWFPYWLHQLLRGEA